MDEEEKYFDYSMMPGKKLNSNKYINYNNHKFVETDTFSLTEEGENKRNSKFNN